MPSSHKKVVVRQFSSEAVRGYLPAAGIAVEGAIDLLGLDGRRTLLPLHQVHSVAYVREFGPADGGATERLTRRAFSGRPRGEGLWIRITFRQDHEVMEGLASAELTIFEDLLRDGGLYMTPPDTRSNTQRLFVPHLAITELHMLGVIRPPGRVRERSTARSGVASPSLQESLFDQGASAPRGRSESGGEPGDG